MEILPQLLLLQKTLVNVEGIGRQLYPELDLWGAARPALERFMLERVGVRRLISTFRDAVPRWADRLPELPALALETLDQIKSGRLKVQTSDPQLVEILAELRELRYRIVWALFGVGLLICAAIVFGMRSEATRMFGPLPFGVWVCGVAGLGAAVCALRGRRRRGY